MTPPVVLRGRRGGGRGTGRCRAARTTADIHDSGAGFLAERLRAADPAQWRTLLSGRAGGPLAVSQKALDLAASHRRDEDLRAVAEPALAASPYRGDALAGLRDAAIRHRRTPREERR
ncbi:hypothetical protein [Streptomyces sp. NPDC058757]|uniref:hypothetical protein n=1 Tax=Streptomyces sp. NPDC058757 TaxID=3346626 RepID=UPI00367534A6